MTLFKSPFSRLLHKSTPVVATNTSLEFWCQQPHVQSTRLVRKVEICSALSSGEDACGAVVDKSHHHTLLRVTLVPSRSSGPGISPDTFLVERVLSTGGRYHSITPVTESLPPGGTFLRPDIHDRICTIIEGSATALARDLEVERTLTFGNRDSQPRITLAQLAHILAFVSRTTEMICDGGDCRFQSRSFAFTCLAALTPSLPPRKVGEGAGARVGDGVEMVDDTVHELSAEAFLVQVPWLVQDTASTQALELIEVLKDGPRQGGRVRLYH